MKNKKTYLGLSFLLVVVLMLTGCGKEIEVKNGSKVAVSLDKNKYTATEYYDKIKEGNISILVDMIDHDLFDEKYKTTDEETDSIDKQISQMKSTYAADDEEQWQTVMRQYFGVDSEEDLRTKLSLEYKRKLAVEDHVKSSLTDTEIQNYYDESIFGDVSASHILIAVDAKKDATDEEKEKAEKKALEKAQKLIKKLDDGEDFKELAKKNSDDESTAINGGDLGYFSLDEMTEEFSNAVKDLKVDEYTKEPIKTEYGYHIILKTGEKDKPKLKEVKEKIEETLRDKKLEEDTSLYYKSLKEIRENNKIKWNDDKLKKAYNKYMNNLIDTASSN